MNPRLHEQHHLFGPECQDNTVALLEFVGDLRDVMLEALYRLRNLGPLSDCGICSNLSGIVSETYGVWYPHEHGSLKESASDIAGELVYKFTGDTCPISGYWDSEDEPGARWQGEQGAARAILINRLIQALE